MHNAEKFIVECLDSVAAQTYKNIEAIVVDDDSSDNSAKITKEYTKKQNNFSYIKTKNGNATKTRRDGLEKATADLVCFVDADDVLDRRYVERLYLALEETKVKMAACNIQTFVGDFKPARQVYDSDKVYTLKSNAHAFADHYHITVENKLTLQTLPCKLFKKELFDDIDYTVLKTNIFEDNFVMAQILGKVKEIGIVDEVLYWYRQSPGSTSGGTLTATVEYEGKKLNSIEYFRDVVMGYCREKLPGPDVDAAIDRLCAVEFFNYARMVPDLTVRAEYLEQKLELEEKRLLDREVQIEARDARLKVKDEQLHAVLNSKSYKVGQKIVKPVNKAANILRRGKYDV